MASRYAAIAPSTIKIGEINSYNALGGRDLLAQVVLDGFLECRERAFQVILKIQRQSQIEASKGLRGSVLAGFHECRKSALHVAFGIQCQSQTVMRVGVLGVDFDRFPVRRDGALHVIFAT